MEKYCKICGVTVDEQGKCSNSHKNKKMCVNCSYVEVTDSGYLCRNEDNMNDAKDRMIKAAQTVSNGYTFTINVSPLPLKNPLAKCGRWVLDEKIVESFKNSFE